MTKISCDRFYGQRFLKSLHFVDVLEEADRCALDSCLYYNSLQALAVFGDTLRK